MPALGNLLSAPAAAPAPEQIIFGVPMTYFIIVLVMCFTIMMLLMMLLWYWMKMGPCRAYFGSVVRGNGELGMLCRQYHQSGRASFIKTDYITGIFKAIGIPMSLIQRSGESYRFGAASLKILCDMTGLATEPVVQDAIKNFVINYNDTELTKDNPAFITDYEDLFHMATTGYNANGEPVDVPAGIKIHIVSEVNTQDIQRFLAHISSEDLDGHVSVRISEDRIKDKQSESPPGWFWLMDAALIVCMIVYEASLYFKG